MAKAKKLASGSWRCQVYDYTDSAGKRHYKSFTSKDPSAKGRRAVEKQAAEYAAGKENRGDIVGEISLREAVERYINLKEGVLSPSTIRAYRSIARNHLEGIGRKPLYNLTSSVLQVWISELAEKSSPKTVRNVYGLLTAVLDMFLPGHNLRATLPAKKKPDLYVPSDEDVSKLLKHIEGTELEIAVLLAAFGPMRRGEICALESSDVQGNRVSVSKSMVMDAGREWHIKQPKTYSGYREIIYPDFVIRKIREKEGKIIKATPEQISNRFRRAVIHSHLPHFRFHDLRHYAASIMHAIGVPDQYIVSRGGWSSDSVMKSIYRNTIGVEYEKQSRKINEHFEAISHEMQHES